jgi:LacI family transcriptional regulator, galactose operon repressor
MKSKQVTIKDIASELNISASTVSRALKDHPYINSATKKQVINLAEKLNYTPNSLASGLRSQRTNTIGVIIPEIVHFFFSTVIAGIQEVANNAGYTIMICQSNESYEREVLDTKALMTHRIDGLLVSFSNETINFDHFREVKKKNIPIVFFDRTIKELDASNVIVTDYEGGRKATKHLLEQGCRRIAHLAGPKHLNISKERQQGYLDALEEFGLVPEQEYVQECGEYKEDGYKCTKRLLRLANPPDAIFANSDMAAFGAMQAIKDFGLRVPDDIAIIGFSNWQFSEMIEPQLSTISQPGIDIGRLAMRLLLDELNSKDEVVKHITKVLPVELIVRGSSLKNKELVTGSQIEG